MTFSDSRPYWRDRARSPRGAPNVVVVLCDDLGFADLSCFGSEIETPHLDRLAGDGVRYTNFHTTPLCAPTRAALLTGIDHHATGVGVIFHDDQGFPGYRGELADTVLTAAEIFRANGYATLAVGKWDLTRHTRLSDAGEKESWPLQRGFDRFYGFLDGYTNLLHPHLLFEDNHVVEVDSYPEGYLLTDDITERAIAMVRAVKASDNEKPFFLYLAHGAPHAPLAAKASDIAKYRGRYDVGWDRIREGRFAKQQELGIFPPGTVMAPRNTEPGFLVEAWQELSAQERELFARYMEAYAAMVDNVDQNFGRLTNALAEIGELENTLIIFLSDNGASREGGARGTTHFERTVWTVFLRLEADDDHFARDYERRELIGGPRVNAHYPWGWGMASNTPFRLYKSTTFAGGHQVPFILSWPARLTNRGEIRNQYAYATDVLPTLVELIGLDVPVTRHGHAVQAFSGSSLAATIANPSASSAHRQQYFEMRGQRGYYRDGWEIVTLHQPRTPFADDEWQLYDLGKDPTELEDLSEIDPERVAELARAWDEAAWVNRVYPLDDGSNGLVTLTHPADDDPARPVTLYAFNHTLPPALARKLIRERSFTITIGLVFLPGDKGILVAHGDQAGGYALYVEHDELLFAVNTYGLMSLLSGGMLLDGTAEIVLDVRAPGEGVWDATLLVDGAARGTLGRLPMWSTPMPVEGIDIGIDRRSPVCWELHERYGSFPYTGTLKSVTYTPGEFAPDAAQRLAVDLRETMLKFD